MTIGSLFSGIGGLDLGLERAGHTVRWQVEANPYCQRILAKHWPHVPCYPDVTQLTGTELAPVDLICGGFPCQPVSHAGLQKGTDDDRWLWPHFARLLGVLRPRYVLLENVPGLLTTNGGHAFGAILADLADSGYDAEWDCLPATAVGAPHLRYRVFIIASLPDAGYTGVHQRRITESPEAPCDGPGRMEPDGVLGECCKERTDLADADHDGHNYTDSGLGRDGPKGSLGQKHEYGKIVRNDPSLADADDQSQSGGSLYAGAGASLSEFASSHQWWESEPDVGRVAHGVPNRVDRLKSLGNAVVPQMAEWLGERLTAHAEDPHADTR